MKKIFNIIAMLICIHIISTSVYAQTYGPNLKGFQLGQTQEQVELNIKNMNLNMEKYDTELIGGLTDSGRIQRKWVTAITAYSGYNIQNKIALFTISIDCNTNKVINITIHNDGISNIWNSKGNRKGFIQAFINHYGIEKVEYNNDINGYIYEDNINGWRIGFLTSRNIEVTQIILLSIDKKQKFNF